MIKLRPCLRSALFASFVAVALFAGLAAVSPGRAVAQAPYGSGFGAPGQIAITGDFEGHLRNGWQLRLHPALDYFIANNVSVGGLVGITYTSGNPSTTQIDLGVRAGYNLNIVDRVSFWPMVGIYYSHFSVSSGGGSGSSTSLGIFAPFLYHIVPHFFLGAGPQFSLALDNGGNGYGLETVVGGWF